MNGEFFAFFNRDFVNLFFIPFGTTFVSVVCRYAEQHDVFRSLQTDRHEQAQAHFDNLRVGVDMVLIGITAVAGVIDVTTKGTIDNLTNALLITLSTLILVQLSLLLGVLFCHLTWRFPNKPFGIFLPNALGFGAAALAIGFFRFSLR